MHPAQSPRLFRFLPSVLAAFVFSSCISTGGEAVYEDESREETGTAVAANAAMKSGKQEKEEDSDPAEELDELRHDVGEAEWEVASAERNLADAERSFAIWNEEREINRGESEDELAKVRHQVRKAEIELQMFNDFDLPEETEDQALSIEGSEFRVMQSQQELDQMTSDYENFGDDPSVKVTAQIVLDRSRQQLEFSRRRLAMTRKNAEKTLQHEMPAKRRSLEMELQWQRNELARAERKAELARREEEGDRIGKEASIEEARHELENARRALRLARKELTKAAKKGKS